MGGILDDYEFQRGSNDRMGANHVPESLPCGKAINCGGRRDQCCKTECPGKTTEEIDECYDIHKYGHSRAHYKAFS